MEIFQKNLFKPHYFKILRRKLLNFMHFFIVKYFKYFQYDQCSDSDYARNTQNESKNSGMGAVRYQFFVLATWATFFIKSGKSY